MKTATNQISLFDRESFGWQTQDYVDGACALVPLILEKATIMSECKHVVDYCTIPESEIVARECRFATYVPPPEEGMDDLHVIKEIIHTRSGESFPNLRLEYGREREAFITRKGYRNHKQHKENEEIHKLQKLMVTESNMDRRLAAALGLWHRGNRRKLFECPYIYGVDITSTAVIKKSYFERWNKTTGFSISELDIETNMFSDEEVQEATMVSISMKGRLATFITKDYLKGFSDPIPQIEALTQKYLGDVIAARGIKPETYIVEDYIDMWRQVFKMIHEWQPDILSIWNVLFELENLLAACEAQNIDIADIICDPRIPKAYRYFDFIKAPEIKKMASGKTMPQKPSQRWHKIKFPASFIMIDQMGAYRQIRTGTGEEPSYALEDILQKELKIGKLKFKELDHLIPASPDWHMAMQSRYKLEYIVYNRQDVLAPEQLDEKLKDLSFTMPSMADTTDFYNFSSQPRRTVDRLHWYVIENKDRVMGVTSSGLVDEYDEETLDRFGWIVALPAALITDQGLPCVKQLPGIPVRVYKDVGDLDVSAAYPHGEVALNTSKETTIRELVSIDGVPEDVFRMQNMGLSSGHVNSVDYCTTMLGFPTHEQMLGLFLKEEGVKQIHNPEAVYKEHMYTDYGKVDENAPKLDYDRMDLIR